MTENITIHKNILNKIERIPVGLAQDNESHWKMVLIKT
jgi:hypothetical protein